PSERGVIFFSEVCRRANTSGSVLDLADAASILWRLELEGVDVGDRWQQLPNMKTHLEDHVTCFNDAHMGAALTRRGDTVEEKHLHDTLIEFTNNSEVDNTKVCKDVGVALYEGMTLFGRGQYDKAAELMLPIRHQIYRIGGSNAQRDVFTQTLIHACIRSTDPAHFQQTQALIDERSAMIKSPITERLAAQFRKYHPM
ncbi:Tetratricopeptide repeat protein 38, partial [Trichostrongylus colubriformis]